MIGARRSSGRADHWITIKAHALNAGVRTVVIRSGGEHRDCRIVIQRQQIEAFFYNGHHADHPDHPSRSDGHEMFETVHDGPFHRNRQSFRSDGYAQMYYKTMCSSKF